MKKILFLSLLFLSGCWSDIDYDYKHEIRCQHYQEIPQCVTNCLNVTIEKVFKYFGGKYIVCYTDCKPIYIPKDELELEVLST